MGRGSRGGSTGSMGRGRGSRGAGKGGTSAKSVGGRGTGQRLTAGGSTAAAAVAAAASLASTGTGGIILLHDAATEQVRTALASVGELEKRKPGLSYGSERQQLEQVLAGLQNKRREL